MARLARESDTCMNTGRVNQRTARAEPQELSHLGRACLACAAPLQVSAAPGIIFVCQACVDRVDAGGVTGGDRIRALMSAAYQKRVPQM